MRRAVIFVLLLAGFAVLLSRPAAANQPAAAPLLAAHAHNDYHHPRPLFDALEHGFGSIEADVWLVEGQLLVAHDRKDVKPERTLSALYLEPLRARVREQGGRVFRGGAPIVLLIDVKSEARATYVALDAELGRFAEMLTSFEGERVTPGAITVIVSGNRAHGEVRAQSRRFAALDGRSTELLSEAPAALYPWISENWAKLSQWRGVGPLPEADLAKLREWVTQAHARGRKLRFWNTPETPEAWRILREAGVDIIGADDLSKLRDFLLLEARR
jgi:hypothetical protein